MLLHILKIAFTYWEGWRDGSRNKEDGEVVDKRSKNRKRKRGGKVVGKGVRKGKYTVVFQ